MVPILNNEKSSTNSAVRKVADFEEQVYDRIELIFSKKID